MNVQRRMLRKRTDEFAVVDAFCFDANIHMVISNDVQVKWSWLVAWIFVYRIETCHALARLGHPQPVKG